MTTAAAAPRVVDRAQSAAWECAPPTIAALVTSYGRSGSLGVLARLTWSDAVALGAMARGSIRHRKLVL